MRLLIRSLPFALMLAVGCGSQSIAPSPPPLEEPPAFFKEATPSVVPVVPQMPTPLPRPFKPFVLVGEKPYPYPTPPMPSAGPDELFGMVLSRGNPAAKISLAVINQRNARTYKIQTDSNGVYHLKDLPEGNYYAHYYNDSDNNKVGYWRTRTVPVSHEQGGTLPAWDVHLVGMKNTPGQGQATRFPLEVEFEPYPLAITYRFRIHDAGGPGGHPLYISEAVPAKGVTSFTFSGDGNQGSGRQGLPSGRYLWGYQWEAGIAGEGGCLFQDFVIP